MRAIVERESNWQPCVVSPKGAVGLMQLMPLTAQRLGVRDRCNLEQNVSGGVRYLAWLMQRFHDDLRLVAAAYYAGEDVIGRRTLAYRNPDVVSYVARIRTTYLREAENQSKNYEHQFGKRCEMKICLSLVHLTTISFLLPHMALCANRASAGANRELEC